MRAVAGVDVDVVATGWISSRRWEEDVRLLVFGRGHRSGRDAWKGGWVVRRGLRRRAEGVHWRKNGRRGRLRWLGYLLGDRGKVLRTRCEMKCEGRCGCRAGRWCWVVDGGDTKSDVVDDVGMGGVVGRKGGGGLWSMNGNIEQKKYGRTTRAGARRCARGLPSCRP